MTQSTYVTMFHNARLVILIGLLFAMIVTTGGCQSTAPVDPAVPVVVAPKATADQLRAAARFSLNATQDSAVRLAESGVLKPKDFLAGVDAILAARAALDSVGLAKPDLGDAIAIAWSIWRMGQAAYVVANAAAITETQAADYEAAGKISDEEFDAYVALVKSVYGQG